MAKAKAAPAKSAVKGGAAQVAGWEDDPQTAVATLRPVPKLSQAPAFTFPSPAPKAGIYPPGTQQFRYWAAAEALRRGADFWNSVIPGGVKWEVGKSLRVLLDEGLDLNAYYDRNALNFFHGPGVGGGTVFSCESPDVVCHEMGHAILDSIKPELWDAAFAEAAAFHESFGDMSAILSALQLPSLRKSIIADTAGRLYRNSRLSRLAEQLGSAIRQRQPQDVDADCLRNAVNSFIYKDPTTLPQSAPASTLSSEPHSFSRVFTSAFFESLAQVLSFKAGQNTPTDAQLAAAAKEVAGILVSGVHSAAVVPNFYAQVAAGMVAASGSVNAAYPPIFKAAFVRRSILSLHSAAQVQSLQLVQAAQAKGVARAMTATSSALRAALSTIALPADHYGLDKPVLVQGASQQPRFAVAAAAVDGNGAVTPPSSTTAATAFVDDLFRLGRVDYQHLLAEGQGLASGRHRASHGLEEQGGGYRLARRLFDCGCSR